MANQIEFYAPAFGLAKAGINFGLQPKAFFPGQFVPSLAPVGLPGPNTPAILAAAFDCGYGKNAACLGVVNPNDWNDLQNYLGNRLFGVISLLKSPAVGVWKLAGYAKQLEKSEKTAASFLLGSIYCRYATGIFHALTFDPLYRFWHFAVASQPAVNLGGVALNPMQGNPDFVAESDNGDWFLIEAKGTLGGLKIGALKEGLLQASKYQNISFVDPATGLLCQKPIASSVCVGTHFDPQTNELQVLHLDPPADRSTGTVELPVVIIKESADLIRFYEAVSQFMSHGIELSGNKVGAVWRTSVALGEVAVGMSQLHWDLRPCLAWAVQALSIVIPRIRDVRIGAVEPPNRRKPFFDLSRILDHEFARSATVESEKRGAWNDLSRLLSEFNTGTDEQTWEHALSYFWSAPTLSAFRGCHKAGEIRSINELWNHLSASNAAMRNQINLTNKLEEGIEADLAATTSGLIFAPRRFID